MSTFCYPSKATVSLKSFFNLIQGAAVLGIEEPKQGLEEKNASVKEKSEIDKQLVICQTTDAAPAENVLTTPSVVECRFVCHMFAQYTSFTVNPASYVIY